MCVQVLYNDKLVTPEALVEAVEDAGFDAMLLSCKKNTPTSVPEVWGNENRTSSVCLLACLKNFGAIELCVAHQIKPQTSTQVSWL